MHILTAFPLKMQMLDGETYTDCALRYTEMTDLILSYWLHNPARRLLMNQLYGHVAADLILVTQEGEVIETPLSDRMLTFMKPFSAGLWLLIAATIVVAGMVMYKLEADFVENHASGKTEQIPLQKSSSHFILLCRGL